MSKPLFPDDRWNRDEPILPPELPKPKGGRPRNRPDHLIGDKGYSYDRCRWVLCRRGIPHTIPERDDQRDRRTHRPDRKPAFCKATYRRRNVAERGINRLK